MMDTRSRSQAWAYWRERIRVLVESNGFCKIITALILINAVVLGMETYPRVMAAFGPWLIAIDHLILWIFVAELVLRLAAYGAGFFRDPWSIFDAVVVALAFIPANETFAVLRAARSLRVLRLISIFPRLRGVIDGLIAAIPGIGSIGAILAIIFYIFAVMATKLFGADYPEWFGTLQASAFSLFQIMTLEGWGDMVREIAQKQPFAKPFFIVYILLTSFTVLNLFIAVIVDAMQREHRKEEEEEEKALQAIHAELARLHEKIDRLAK